MGSSSPEPTEPRPKFCGVMELDVTNYYSWHRPDGKQVWIRGPERRLILDSDGTRHVETRPDA